MERYFQPVCSVIVVKLTINGWTLDSYDWYSKEDFELAGTDINLHVGLSVD